MEDDVFKIAIPARIRSREIPIVSTTFGYASVIVADDMSLPAQVPERIRMRHHVYFEGIDVIDRLLCAVTGGMSTWRAF